MVTGTRQTWASFQTAPSPLTPTVPASIASQNPCKTLSVHSQAQVSHSESLKSWVSSFRRSCSTGWLDDKMQTIVCWMRRGESIRIRCSMGTKTINMHERHNWWKRIQFWSNRGFRLWGGTNVEELSVTENTIVAVQSISCLSSRASQWHNEVFTNDLSWFFDQIYLSKRLKSN